MNTDIKKKRFVYKSVVGNDHKDNHSDQEYKRNTSNNHFPDDLSSVVSQPNKKPRLTLEEKGPKVNGKKSNGLVNDIEFGDDNDDFNEMDFAEIDQIEILASQQPSTIKYLQNLQEPANLPKPSASKPFSCYQEAGKDDVLDELLGFSSSRQNIVSNKSEKPKTLIVPSSKSFLNHSTSGTATKSPHKPINASELAKSAKRLERKNKEENFTTSSKQTSFMERNIENSYQKQYNEAQRKANEYKEKLENVEKKFNSKDGEIKILREKLRKSSEDDHKMKERIVLLENSMKSQQSEKESKLLKEIDRLKTQLEFKEKEVHDAMEKEKLHIRQKTQSSSLQSPARKSHFPDGFQNTEKTEIQHQSIPKKSSVFNQVDSSESHTCSSKQPYFSNSLKSCFIRNAKHYTQSGEIITKLSELSEISYSVQLNPEYSCKHKTEELFQEENTNELLTFVTDIHNSIDLVEQDGFFVPNFMINVVRYLKKIETLFECQTEMTTMENEETCKRQNCQKLKTLKGSMPDCCTKCDQLYEIGFKSLFVLKESCIVYSSVRKYLLDGFSRKQGNNVTRENNSIYKTKETINGVEYFYKFPNKGCSILVQSMSQVTVKEKDTPRTNHEFAVQLWETLLSLQQNKMWIATLEDLCFEFYVNLLSEPIPGPSTISFLKYLADKEILSSYLRETTLDRVLQVIQVLLNCSPIKEVTVIICSDSERCPLLTIYNVLLAIDCDDHRKMLLVFQKLVCLLLSLLAQQHIEAYQLLLDSSCQCSNDVIECLITILFDEFKILRKKVFHPLFEEIEKCDRERMAIFRSGISLLCKLCSNDKHLNEKRSAVEWSYFNLLTGTIKMYRKIPAISENEVIAIEDLLDQDQFLEFDGTKSIEEGDEEMKQIPQGSSKDT